MISRSAIKRGSQLALRRPVCAHVAQTRGFASPAPGATGTGSASYEPTSIGGLKVASKDAHGPTTKLALVVKAGTRYQPQPGLTVGLEEFAFKNTTKRSALRITRETELLGGQLKAYHTREAVVLEAAFLRDDLPYFVELLGEVANETRYTTHELHEEVEQTIHLAQEKLAHDSLAQAVDGAHAVAFHTGLGAPVLPSTSTPLSKYMNEHSIAAFAGAAYTKSNVALVADGASQSGLQQWVDSFFKDLPSQSSSEISLLSNKSTYHGGEHRVELAGKSSYVIAFPSASIAESKPEIAVIEALLGGNPSLSWSTGFTLLSKAAANAPGANAVAKNLSYSDAGLLTIQITGAAPAVRKLAEESVKALKSIAEGGIAQEDLAKAIAKAKFNALTAHELTGAGIVAAGTSIIHGAELFQAAQTIKNLETVTPDKIKAAAKAIIDGKASVSAVDQYTTDNFRTTAVQFPPTRQKTSITTSKMTFAWKAAGITYNRYLAIAGRAVRRSLKEDKRIVAERRGEMELRFAKWNNGKQGEVQNLAEANNAAAAGSSSS
ncbi:hypothetical protein PspLS_00884 [Pyricularia sp. CBS 133598]|nr:hypothetical protein PspLS_00884 [Pyricularia sp. CBS 133598]